MKRYDTSQSSWVDVNSTKRYDATQQSWVDVNSLKRYDTSQKSWVDVEGGYINFRVEAKQSYNIQSATTSGDGLGMSVKFGAYYKDYITFVADGLDIPAESTISFDYQNTNSSYALPEIKIYLSNYSSDPNYYSYATFPAPSSSGSWTDVWYKLERSDLPTNYGSIHKIKMRFYRYNDEWIDADPITVAVKNVVVGNKKFKFPTVSL